MGHSILWVSSAGGTRLGVPVRARVSVGVTEVLSGGREDSMETKLSLLSSRKR